MAAAAETETEGEAEGRIPQWLLLLCPMFPPPRCGVEWPESGMEQEGGAEEAEPGASAGRRRLDAAADDDDVEVEAATPGSCCRGDADDVVPEVDASASNPPLLAPRRCVAVVAVPIRHDAEPPSERKRVVEERGEKR